MLASDANPLLVNYLWQLVAYLSVIQSEQLM